MSFLAFAFFLSAFAQQQVSVKTFTPEGLHKNVEQIRIEFNQPMVKLGEFHADTPAQSNCFKNGQGRWVDTKNWVYDFTSPLPGGVACEVKVGSQAFRFSTGGPHILNIFPRSYRAIDPEQNFVVFLDSEAKKESITTGAYFVIQGLGDRIPVKLIEGREAEKIRDSAVDEYRYEKEFFKGPWVVLRSTRPFPPEANVSLIWSKEIQSPQGARSRDDETLEFTVEKAFKAEFSCEREATGKPCVPLLPMRLSFSAPIRLEQAKAIYLQTADGKKIFPSQLQGKEAQEQISYLEFPGPFNAKSRLKLVLPEKLRDDENHELANKMQFPLAIETGEDPSLLKFTSSFGIVENEPSAALPVTLRNVEKSLSTKFYGWSGRLSAKQFKEVIQSMAAVDRDPYGEKRLKLSVLAQAQKIEVQKPLVTSQTEVVGIPLKNPGFYVVEMQSALLGKSLLNKNASYFVRSSALLTKMAVHVKFAKSQVWAWVTDLKTAQPVSEAQVKIYDVMGNIVGTAQTNKQGLALAELRQPIENLPRNNDNSSFYEGFFAVAEKGDDFSFTYSAWDQGIESWRFQIGNGTRNEGLIGHAILDRTLFKPEEQLSAKVVLRKSEGKGLALPSAKEWPGSVVLTHDSGLQSFKLPLAWDKKNGTAVWQWLIPAGAKYGRWTIQLKGPGKEATVEVGSFHIESFRVPLIQVRVQGAQPQFVQEKSIPLSIAANYFSGGPAANLPMKIRWSVEPGAFSAQDSDLQEFIFANGSVKEGIFRSGDEDNARFISQSGVQEKKLDKNGALSFFVDGVKYAVGPQRLRIDAEYSDPNGEIKDAVQSFGLWPSEAVLGIKTDSWSATQSRVALSVAALDLLQRPLANQKVQVDLYTSRYYSHRKRLIGGFYAYEDFQEVKKVGELCKGKTDAKGLFKCVGKTQVTGSVIAVVSTKDAKGNLSQANVNQWIVADGETQWFGTQADDRADLIPFKKNYEPGETAEFQLRTPFKDAKVLVTVERESVLYREVIDVKGDNPVLRIPIKKEYAPNVVVSAFAIRGRLNDPKPTALIDLGKPAFKLGLSEIKVGWKENSLKVTVDTDKKTFHARDKAKVHVSVTDHHGKPAKNGQVVLVAVDEGLLELQDNKSWDLLSAMMGLRPYSVKTATAQTFVIGKRHFGLKAVPVGGDGGGRGGPRRELFDTLLYWNPNVKLNKNGEADVELALNDSTTSFRIAAIAQQGKEQFGTGWTSIQSSQELMIIPGLSQAARIGDEFTATFTVRNASLKSQAVTVSLKTTPETATSQIRTVTLDPGVSSTVNWKVKVPKASQLEYLITARDDKGRVLDQVRKSQTILPLREARIYQSEFSQWPAVKSVQVKEPAAAEPGSSSIVVEAVSSLGDLSSGQKEFWAHYRFNCLEQQVSRAVSLNDLALWKKIEQGLMSSMDSQGLLKYFPAETNGSIELTAYVLSVAHEAGFSLSEDNEARLVSALSSYAEGRLKEVTPSGRVDEVLKKVSVFATLSRYRRLNVGLLDTVKFEGTEWPLSTLVEWYQILRWEKGIKDRETKLANLEALLRNRFYFSAQRLMLRNEGLDSMPWLMRDGDGALLHLVLTAMDDARWDSDVPRLMQGILSRQKSGAWGLTTSNAWGRLAQSKFDKKFQNEKVYGTFTVNLGKEKVQQAWEKKAALQFELPLKEKADEVQLAQIGSGRPWVTVSAKAAVAVTQPISAGFTVSKTITPLEQKIKGRWSVGDTAKIELNITPKSLQTWVVIDDPIPVGATIMDVSSATAVERKEDRARFYFNWFSGSQTVEYKVRFNQAGNYLLPAGRVEAMYSPDVFAEWPESRWSVSE